jgi:sugar phosphate isomerase/epimerase
MLRLGYNTNGFNCHSLDSALEIISATGYQGVAITLDNYILNPWDPDLNRKLEHTAENLKKYSLSCVIETGSRFLLNPWKKHDPTLISRDTEGRKKRLDFLKKALEIADSLNAEALSFWSGRKHNRVEDSKAWEWLIAGCRELSNAAEKYALPLAFEPEPGMFVENLSQYRRLKDAVGSDLFGLTMDVGHVFLTENTSVGECIRKLKDEIRNIHIEDMKKSVHHHLFFGEGEMDFTDIFKALGNLNCNPLVNVELSRHSHHAVDVAKASFEYLKKFESFQGSISSGK